MWICLVLVGNVLVGWLVFLWYLVGRLVLVFSCIVGLGVVCLLGGCLVGLFFSVVGW